MPSFRDEVLDSGLRLQKKLSGTTTTSFSWSRKAWSRCPRMMMSFTSTSCTVWPAAVLRITRAAPAVPRLARRRLADHPCASRRRLVGEAPGDRDAFEDTGVPVELIGPRLLDLAEDEEGSALRHVDGVALLHGHRPVPRAGGREVERHGLLLAVSGAAG